MTSIQKHLDTIRKKAHETQIKNGHYKKMAKLSVLARRNKKLSPAK